MVAVLGRRCQVAIADGVDDEFGADVVRDGPADDPPGPDIDDRGAVDLPFAGGVFGDVGAPQPVRAGRGELPVDQVLVRARQRPVAGSLRWWETPTSPAAVISRAIRLRPQQVPSPSRSSAWTRGAP